MKKSTLKSSKLDPRLSTPKSQPKKQDDSLYSDRYFKGCGEILFYRNYAYEQVGHPFISVTHDVRMENLGQIMSKNWKMSPPRIVTLVISNLEPLKEWSNDPQLISSFQNGIMKAAHTTKMWLFTNGANIGITKIIGEAVSLKTKELLFTRAESQDKNTMTPRSLGLTIIGIVREDLLRNSNLFMNDFLFDKKPGNQEIPKVKIENQGNLLEERKFELDSDHTHFLNVRDESHYKNGVDGFMMRLMHFLAESDKSNVRTLPGKSPGKSSTSGGNKEACSLRTVDIPIVSILAKGGYECSKLIVECLRHQYPIVILQGTGGLADLISSAYLDLYDRTPEENWGSWDPEFVDNYLKPEINNRIMHLFPKISSNSVARNLLQNRIMEILRLSRRGPNQYLTIMEANRYAEYENLSVHLLKALFKVRLRHQDFSPGSPRPAGATQNFDEKINKELSLTMDWNCADVAKNEVLTQDPAYIQRLPKDLFMNALIQPHRQDFIDLFLSHGFRAHSFITPTRLRRLFLFVCEEEFFRSVCWEGVLGHSPHSRPGRSFVKNELNWLIETCTGISNFINPDHLYYNVLTLYIHDAANAERQAIAILCMWAVFSHRIKLARILWRHTDQPIHLALIISMILSNMAPFVSESNIRSEYEIQAKTFAALATGVLGFCYETSLPRALELLSEQTVEWNGLTAVDIAAYAHLKVFIAHPCCQKWLTNRFMGKVQIREATGNLFSVPASIKIITAAYMILPMYIWVLFRLDREDSQVDEDALKDELEDEEGRLTQIVSSQASRTGSINLSQMFPLTRRGGGGLLNELKSRELFLNQNISLIRMVHYLWTAPITKFYNHQIFYMVYLGLLCYIMLLPSCKKVNQDTILSVWTLTIALEFSRRKLASASSGHLAHTNGISVFDVLFVWAFWLLYSLDTSIIFKSPLSPYGRKVVLSFGIVYFFHRLIVVYLTISPTLGPWIYRLKLMVIVDFVNFMKMALLVIVAGGVVLQALLYPDNDLSWDVIHDTFHRSWYSLFLTPLGDLEPAPDCSKYEVKQSSGSSGGATCHAGKYNTTGLTIKCPTDNFWPYFYALWYFVLLKLVLLTLLYALFSNTATQIEQETDLIWKFQRYMLVEDFLHRLPIPPPFVVLTYPILMIQSCCHGLIHGCGCCKGKDKKPVTSKRPGSSIFHWPRLCPRWVGSVKSDDKTHWEDRHSRSKLTNDDYNYWRHLAREFDRKLGEQDGMMGRGVGSKLPRLMPTSSPVASEESHRNVLRRMSVRITELERIVQKSVATVENLEKITAIKMNRVERDARRRVGDRSQDHILARQSPYPGTTIRRARVPDKYIPWEVLWIDYDPPVYTKPKQDFPLRLQPYVDQDIISLQGYRSPSKVSIPEWNVIGNEVVDRTSWIIDSTGHRIVYKMENSIPTNPYGRTGLRGKGALPRWGPNHYIVFLVTRSQSKQVRTSLPQNVRIDCLVAKEVEGETRNISLPMCFVPTTDLFRGMETFFLLPEDEHWTDFGVVKEFFASSTNPSEFKFEFSKGTYMDDPYNTDNAWRELRLYHFHLSSPETLSRKIHQNKLTWAMVNENMIINLPSSHSVILHDVMRSMSVTIE